MEHCEALLLCLEVKWSKSCITAILGSSFPFSRNSSEVCVGIPFHDRSSPFFFWLEIVVSPCSLLNGGFPSSHLPCALKHGQSQALAEVKGGRVQGIRGSVLRMLVQVFTGGCHKKHSLADGSSLPHLREATWIFPVGTAAWDQLTLEACRAIG